MKILLNTCFLLILSGCQTIQPPQGFVYKEISTSQFKLASWQKISDINAEYHIYIEGDGYAFNAWGQPSHNPTPHGELMIKISFSDKSPNVIYLARPCQFVTDNKCKAEYWTTKRFSPEVIEAEYEAIKTISKGKKNSLIGFSGGAQIAGLVAVKYPDINVSKIITIAGNLNHQTWTEYHHIPSLNGSLNLADYQDKFALIPQIHYVGENDEIVPPFLTQQFLPKAKIIFVKNATHNKGWEKIYPLSFD